MILYIALKDIKSFFRSEKKVFIWLLICMVCGSFALNFSYSFARYCGKVYEHSSDADVVRYKINGYATAKSVESIFSQISNGDFPDIKDYQLFKSSENGYTIAGSSVISERTGEFTGLWSEGYFSDIQNDGTNACAVDEKLLDFGDKTYMSGEIFVLDEEEYTIKGVFEPWETNTGVVIFADKFLLKYHEIDSLWITFTEQLNESQSIEFKNIIKENIEHANVIAPLQPGEYSEDLVTSYFLQYSIIIIMLVICLVSLLKYWQSVNLPAYTVYWINGATKGNMLGLSLCESLVMCGFTYIIGLGLNAASRCFFLKESTLTLGDIGFGFVIFFGTFGIFTMVNTFKLCSEFKTANGRRD